MNFQDLQPYHDVVDTEKFNQLVESMTVNGWQGSPLVVHEGHLLNGSHRYAAACQVRINDYTFEPKIVELADIFDLDEIEDLDLIVEGCGWQLEVTETIRKIDPALCEEYGLDIH
jgi:hypothetical protein